MVSNKQFHSIIVVSFLLITTLAIAGFLGRETLANPDPVQPIKLAKVECLNAPPGGPICGNNLLDSGESCDMVDGSPEFASNLTCVDLGFDTGTLACNAACMIDDSGCGYFGPTPIPGEPTPTPQPNCGNGIRDYLDGEDCDGFDYLGSPPTAPAVTCEWPEIRYCDGNCHAGCRQCEDGTVLCIRGVEECEGANLCGNTCASVNGFPDRTLSCYPAGAIDEWGHDVGCLLNICACGDKIQLESGCYGEGYCDEFDKWRCEDYPDCTWTPNTPSTPTPSSTPEPWGSPLATPAPSDPDDGECSGFVSCDGSTSEECSDQGSLCDWRRAINGCWGPPVPCGSISDVTYDNSGMHCSFSMSCQGFGGVYWYNISGSGNGMCDLGEDILEERPNGTFWIHIQSTGSDAGDIWVRKLLKELPLN